jgi:hypothetical protein
MGHSVRSRIELALKVALLAAISCPVACLSAVQTWTRWEHTLTSAKPHADGDGGVTLRVTYSGPSQERITGLGFWDGDRTFKTRCLFPKPGTWTWKTECSDADDSGLHNHSGRVEVEAYSGSNPLYRHGYLRVSANRRYLEHADGKPFLWIGDTAWAAPMNARMDDWQTYLRDRREKGFTGLQVFCASDWAGKQDTAGNSPFLGEGPARPNPAYWQQYDRKKLLDQPSARGRETKPSARIASRLSQRGQATLLEPPLASPGGAYRVAKGTGHIVLIRPALLDEAHHGVGLGHAVAHRILGQGHPRHQHNAVTVLRADLTPVIDEQEG